MSKYIDIYERLSKDILYKDDPRRAEIIAEMRAIHRAKTQADAAKIIDWWHWESPGDCVRWVKRARKLMAAK